MAQSQRGKATLFVGGLAPMATSHTLHDAFIPFGPIIDVSLPAPELPSSTEPHRGFGYVEFEAAEDAKEAIDNMDQSELFGRVIRVNVAKEKKAEGEGLGSKTAVWEQEGYLAQHAVSEEDRQQGQNGLADEPMDAMQGLEQMDVAGPKLK
ncbi:hypothetical protein MBLNU457_g2519t1 [Dothideomycetes sp. NU457]